MMNLNDEIQGRYASYHHLIRFSGSMHIAVRVANTYVHVEKYKICKCSIFEVVTISPSLL